MSKMAEKTGGQVKQASGSKAETAGGKPVGRSHENVAFTLAAGSIGLAVTLLEQERAEAATNLTHETSHDHEASDVLAAAESSPSGGEHLLTANAATSASPQGAGAGSVEGAEAAAPQAGIAVPVHIEAVNAGPADHQEAPAAPEVSEAQAHTAMSSSLLSHETAVHQPAGSGTITAPANVAPVAPHQPAGTGDNAVHEDPVVLPDSPSHSGEGSTPAEHVAETVPSDTSGDTGGDGVLAPVGEVISDVGDVVGDVVSGVGDLVGGLLGGGDGDGLLSNVGSTVGDVVGAVGDVVSGVGDLVGGLLGGGDGDGLLSGVGSTVENVVDTVGGVVSGVGDLVSGLLGGGDGDGLLSGVGSVVGNVTDTVGDLVSGVGSTVGNVVEAVSDVVSGVGSAVGGVVDTVGGIVSGVGDLLGGLLGGGKDALADAGSAVGHVVETVGDATAGAGSAAGGALDTAGDAISGAGDAIGDLLGGKDGDGPLAGAGSLVDGVLGTVGGAVAGIGGLVGGLLGGIGSASHASQDTAATNMFDAASGALQFSDELFGILTPTLSFLGQSMFVPNDPLDLSNHHGTMLHGLTWEG
jgi:hypothetical protein